MSTVIDGLRNPNAITTGRDGTIYVGEFVDGSVVKRMLPCPGHDGRLACELMYMTAEICGTLITLVAGNEAAFQAVPCPSCALQSFAD